MRTLSATAHKYNSKNLKLIMRIRKEVLLQIVLLKKKDGPKLCHRNKTDFKN